MNHKRLTPITLGEKANISKSSIYSYIDGKRKPNKKSREKLATFFEVSPLDLENKRLYPPGYEENYNKTDKIVLLQEPKPSYLNPSTFQVNALENLEKIIILLKEENISKQSDLSYLLESLKFSLQKEAVQSQLQADKIEGLLQENAELKNKKGE